MYWTDKDEGWKVENKQGLRKSGDGGGDGGLVEVTSHSLIGGECKGKPRGGRTLAASSLELDFL